MKIVLNKCFGGFGVTEPVYKELGLEWDGYGCPGNEDFGIEDNNDMAYRSDPKLIAAIEKVGIKESSGSLADLQIVDIPDDIEWHIDEYDGIETVHESHRSW